MNDRVFLDTNIFVYTQSSSDLEKHEIALKAIREFDCYTSTQVFNEVSSVLLKKFKMPAGRVKQIIFAINKRCKIHLVDFETVQKALDLKEAYGYSYYDSLIIAAAFLSDCKYVFSEDLQDGQLIENKIEIVNIFKRNAEEGQNDIKTR